MAEQRRIGNFELLERVGQGGMGTVFKARQISMDRIVAVKILPPTLAKQPGFIDRFFREARASARLSHPNIVGGIDVGQDANLYYFAMEFVEGLSAKDILAKKEKFSEQRVLKIGKAMAQALAHAHAHGILHRDIKPDNILLDKSGTPKLCDLGLARLDTQSELEKGLTQQGQAVGTPHYISPEQARGQRDLDPKTDLYSLGATLYHMLTGKTLFDGPTAVVVMTKHITEKAPNPRELVPDVSKNTVAVLAKLVAKDRADRYTSAEKLAEDFDRVARGKAPRHAELAPSKWPFAGETALPAAAAAGTAPVKKTATAVLADRPRTVRRGTRGFKAVGGLPWYVPASIAALILLVLGAVLGLGRRKPLEHADDGAPSTPGSVKSAVPEVPRDQPKPAMTVSLPGKGPGDVRAVAPRVAPQADVIGFKRPTESAPRVAPQADGMGFRKPNESALRVAPKAEPIGFAQPSATGTPAAAPTETATPKTEPDTKAAKTPDQQPGAGTAAVAAPQTPPEDPSKAAAGPELANLISKALVLGVESKFREAADIFRPALEKQGKLDAFDRELAMIHADGYTGLAEMKTLVADKLKTYPNKFEARTVLPKMPPGSKLVGADDRFLFVKDQGLDTKWEWAKLPPEGLQLAASTVLGTLPPNASIGLAVMAYDGNNDKDDAFARKALATVGGASAKRILELVDLRDKLLIAKKQAVQNAYAEKLLYEMDEAMAAGNFALVQAKGAQVKAKYAGADAAKERGAELDETLELAKLAASLGAAAPQPGNVALDRNGAVATGTESAPLLIDGNATEYTGGNGFASMTFPNAWVVTLPKVCLLRQIRMLLWDIDADRFYRYQIEVSHDGQKYSMVADRSKGEWRTWQVIDFVPRPVKSIRIKGLYNSVSSGFYAVELEAYCVPPATAPKSARFGAQAPPPPRPPGPPGPPPKVPPPPRGGDAGKGAL